MSLRYAAAFTCFLLLASTATYAGRSNSLLDVSPDGKRLLAANTDNGTVTLIDTTKNTAVREIHVGKKPESVSWIGNGPRAIATCYVVDRVVIFDTETGKTIKTLTVDDEPYGVVADKAGKFAYVTHDYPGIISEIDLTALKVTRRFHVGEKGKASPVSGESGKGIDPLKGTRHKRWLRGISFSPDEKRLYVTSFYSAELFALDRETGAVVDAWKGHSTDNLCRHVLIHPKRPKAYLSHVRSMIKIISGRGSIFPHLTIYDLRPKKENRRTSIGMDTFNGVYVVTNAWETDMTPDGKLIYTIYAGTNDMNISRVIDDDYREMSPLGLPRRVGKNPRAVRVSPDGSRVYVYNAMDFAVSVHDQNLRRLATVTTCQPPMSPEWVRGKVLFNSAMYPMTRPKWVSCSSCHPDANHDGRTWFNPEGMRRTTAFFGMAHTLPLHWSGDRDETQDFEYTIRSPLMTGGGLFKGSLKRKFGYQKVELEQKLSGVSKDLDALAIYCNSFEFTLSPHIQAPGKLFPAAERGKQIFFSKESRCTTCHSGPYFSDSQLKKPLNVHDVGTGGDDPSEKMGSKYDTPTLLGVYRQRMYLHHGKAKTLRDVITTCNKGDKHGKTSHLSPQQIDDVVTFLKSLPYEQPPTMTANTTKYRFVPKK